MARHFNLILLAFLFSIPFNVTAQTPLKSVRITIDPGHGLSADYDFFRVGPTGEREEWINLRVANLLSAKLRAAGAIVLMTRDTDRDISLSGRASLAIIHESDFLVSIHHNGSSDPDLDFPIVYIWGSAQMNPASVDLANCLLVQMKKDMTFEQQGAGAIYSDFLIYSRGTSLLRNTVDSLPAIIGEGGFFSCAKAEERMKDTNYNELEAETYFKSILAYVSKGIPKATLQDPGLQKSFQPGSTVTFQLTDGLSNHHFQEKTIVILQDDLVVPFQWNKNSGLLTVNPQITDQKSFTLRVFGRNLKGNALHPKRWHFTTQNGLDWRITKSWREAFEKAEFMMQELGKSVQDRQELTSSTEKCIHFYQLSLQLQPANPKARVCEEGLLKCYQMQKQLLNLDTTKDINYQKKRLKDYYP